jgi:hypothetical protein
VLVMADGQGAMERAREGAEQAGCRVSGWAGIEEAVARLDLQVSTDAVLVEIDGEGSEQLEALLDRLNAAAESGRHGSVVSAPLSMVDRIAARTPHPRVQQLCEASASERILAVELAVARPRLQLEDVSKGRPGPRLQDLKEQVERMAATIASISDEERGQADKARGEVDAGFVRAVHKARRVRAQYFAEELFADPAWDMFLDLFEARLTGRQVSVSSLCIAAAVPATTALRWIKGLTDQGLFVRIADPQDGRRVFIALSDDTAARLHDYLSAAQRISPLLI